VFIACPGKAVGEFALTEFDENFAKAADEKTQVIVDVRETVGKKIGGHRKRRAAGQCEYLRRTAKGILARRQMSCTVAALVFANILTARNSALSICWKASLRAARSRATKHAQKRQSPELETLRVRGFCQVRSLL